eukprot:XP_011670899.1 PREDICTED: histone-lysine N-methyltransferase 2D isoform X2 [Strongylocentrotus purpuratus]
MSDVGANQAEIPMAILKSFYSHGNDDKAYSSDDFERYKRKNYCSELQGGRLNFYESGEPNYNTTTAVVKVEKRRGTNILILRCGPEGRMVIFLEFDSKQLTDEWQEALCRYTGQTHVPNPALRRVNSERPAVARRRNRSRARSRTTLPDIIVEQQVDSDPQEAPLEAPQEAPPAPLVAHSETPQEAPLEASQEAPPAPLVAPSETPHEVPQEAPPAPLVAHSETSQEAPLEALQEAPLEVPQEAPPAPLVAPSGTPQDAPPEAPQESLQEAPLEVPQEAPSAPLIAPSETPQEAPLEAPPAPPLDSQEGLSAPPSPPGSPTEDRVISLTSDTSDTDSGPDSLRSRDADLSPTLTDLANNSVKKEFNLSDLEQLKVKDYEGDVIVAKAIPPCQLHLGDKIGLRNDQGRPMNAREMTKLIQTSPEQTKVFTIVRGAVCIVREEESELAINIKRSQKDRLDTVDLILRALTSQCSLPYSEMPERSNFTITAINNIPVDIGSQPDQQVDSDSEQDETPPEGLEETLPAPPVTTPETPQEAPLEAPQESPLDGRQVALPALLVTTPETPQEAPLEAPQEAPLEGRPEVPPARPVATPSAPGSPIEERVPSLTIGTNETDDCDDAQNDSGPGRLRSLSPTLADLAKNSVENEFNLSDLEQLKVRDFTGDVIVKDEFPLRQLHVGDKILLRNARGLAMNARELIEHIRTSIVLTLERGAVCTAREEGNELAINIKGSQTVRLDTVDLIRRACTSHCSLPNAEMPEISNLTITEINNIPVAIGSQPDQIAGSMREALETSGGNLTLHLVPQSLLDALAE